MANTLKELRTHFPPSGYRTVEDAYDSPTSWKNSDLIKHFFTIHGVNVIVEGYFFVFKYSVWCLIMTNVRYVLLKLGPM